MVTELEERDARAYAVAQLEKAGVVLTDAERDSIDVADFGLSRLEETADEFTGDSADTFVR